MSEQPGGVLEIRSKDHGVEVVGVNFPDRTIEVIVMPYETEAMVVHQGRMVREIVSRGAFDGIERRANRVRVNRDHDVSRTVGRAVALHPSRDEGLVAELRIANTRDGDDTLSLADEGCLDASAGFLPMADGESWPARNLRRLTKLWLGHIAMVPDPAYETANVLAVRSQAAADGEGPIVTPNLDLVRSWLVQERFDRLTRNV